MYGPHYSQPNPQGQSPDNVISPKRAGNLNYNAFRSSIGTYPKEARLLPTELRPVLNHENNVKDDDNLRESNATIYSISKPSGFQNRPYRIPRRPRSTPPLFARNNFVGPNRCSNTPDIYRHILGPTPDESILAGLQTVIDICGLVDYCRSDSEVSITSADYGRHPSHSPSTKYDRPTSPYGQNVYDSYAVSNTKTRSSTENKIKSREDTSINMDDTFMTAQSGAPSVDRTFETPNSSFIETSTPKKNESVPIRKKENSHSQQSRTQSLERDVSFDSATSYREESFVSPISEDLTSTPPSLQESRERSFEQFTEPSSQQRSFAAEESTYGIDSPIMSRQNETLQVERDEDAGSIERHSSGSWCKIDECCGTADSVPCVTVKTKDGKHVCIKYRCRSIQSSLSTKCFPPVEIPPCDFSCKKCSIMGSTLNLSDLNVPIGGGRCTCSSSVASIRKRLFKNRHNKKESKSVVIQDPRARVSLLFDPRYTCNRDYEPPADKPRKDFRLGRSIPPAVQPVIGVCTEGRCGGTNAGVGGGNVGGGSGGAGGGGERLLEVRYALVRISVFPSYTTYEIMKSSKKKPKKVPDSVEGIFVTKR